MRRADLITAVVLALVSVVVWHDATSYPASLVPGAPGGAAFPRVLSVGLLLLSILLFADAWKRRGDAPDTAVAWQGAGKSAVVLGMLVLFAALAGVWDFYVLLYVVVVATMGVMGERRALALLGLPVLFVAFVYLVFHRVFGVDFPSAYL